MEKGQNYYFLENVNGVAVCHYGEFIGVIPKYNFTDDYSSHYEREQSYLFNIVEQTKKEKNKAISNPNYIFETLDDVIKYGNDAVVLIYFSYSVLNKLGGNAHDSIL